MSKKKRVNPILSTLLLKPLSLAYGAVTGTRNKMFDFGILAQREFDIPVLVVGNIAAGGTGKTPPHGVSGRSAALPFQHSGAVARIQPAHKRIHPCYA